MLRFIIPPPSGTTHLRELGLQTSNIPLEGITTYTYIDYKCFLLSMIKWFLFYNNDYMYMYNNRLSSPAVKDAQLNALYDDPDQKTE